MNSGALSIWMVWKAWDWLRPPGVQAEVSRRFEGDGEESLQGRLRRSHREEGGNQESLASWKSGKKGTQRGGRGVT